MPDLTPNINLKKPLLNEAANIEVINDNMDKIDSEIAKVRDSAKREHLADLFTNGIIPNALKELKITQTDTPSKAIKIETGKINIDGIVYTFSESTTLNIEPSDALDVTNEPHTSNTSCKLKLTYFPLANQAGDGLATKSDITVTRVSDGSVVNVISINAQTGEVTTDTPNESLQVDYKSFSKRIDIVYLDTYDGTLKVLKGTPVLPTFNPNIPNLKEETFELGKINLSPDFNAVVDNMIKSDRVFYNINGIEDNFNEVNMRMDEFAKYTFDVLLNTTLESDVSEVAFDVDPYIYEKVFIEINNLVTTVGANRHLLMRFNNLSSSYETVSINSDTSSVAGVSNSNDVNIPAIVTSSANSANNYGYCVIEIYLKQSSGRFLCNNASVRSSYIGAFARVPRIDINNIKLYPQADLFGTGSNFKVVGVKKLG